MKRGGGDKASGSLVSVVTFIFNKKTKDSALTYRRRRRVGEFIILKIRYGSWPPIFDSCHTVNVYELLRVQHGTPTLFFTFEITNLNNEFYFLFFKGRKAVFNGRELKEKEK